jgi:hypothetical protein
MNEREIAQLYTDPRVTGSFGPLAVFLRTLKEKTGYEKLTKKELSKILTKNVESYSVEHDRQEHFPRRLVLAEGCDTVWFADVAIFQVRQFKRVAPEKREFYISYF